MSETPPSYVGYVSGAIAGVVSGIVGHPADTMKVRIQIQGLTVMEAARMPLFQGLGAGVLCQVVVGSVLFGTYERIHSVVESAPMAGAFTGFCISPVTCVLESWKCRAQAMVTTGRLGLAPTAARCALGNAAYFSVYESGTDVLLTGTLAGVAYWSLALPFDVIKSQHQVGLHGGDFFTTLVRLPPSHLWRGFLPAVLRAAPMNISCFAAYSASNDILASLFSPRR